MTSETFRLFLISLILSILSTFLVLIATIRSFQEDNAGKSQDQQKVQGILKEIDMLKQNIKPVNRKINV
ncbi:Hypothetical protein LUCI_2181 [Lucifera butyrica]|uniref:Uncharacterized protein n=1 Tax=Lucifera butyrica TaxID=1351585 RepID=A0A498R6W1_9FIRM|nr:hypothetical protein [Lucifera butyrica]VBB06939.1 Hypothetical protein LUCI_2181 [Lucifera butyrica]